MESLQLPQDLYWDGKMEQISPSSEIFSLSNSEELWLFEDNFAKDSLDDDKKPQIDEIEIPSDEELLYEFEFDVKQEQWIEGKPDGLPTAEYGPGILPQPVPAQIVKVENPYEIIMELEKIYGSVELTQLTPPQTPPQQAGDGKEIYNFMGEIIQSSDVVNNNLPLPGVIPAMSPVSSIADYSSDTPGSPMTPDIAREMQIVDEILRNRAKDLPDDWNDDVCSMSSSSNSQSNDDEWLPSASPGSSCSSPGKISGTPTKKRSRPYGRGIDDKKSRKKEQNKNAATRYRQKKKHEMEEILEEERLLAKRNEDLQSKVVDVEKEIKYLKQLIKELYGPK